MINVATFLLDNYLSNPNYTDSDGISVLSWACKNSLESIGMRLLDIENIDTSKLDLTNKSALNYAVENKLVKISEKLIEILIILVEKNKTIKK
jgi:ankyrin repeat protein